MERKTTGKGIIDLTYLNPNGETLHKSSRPFVNSDTRVIRKLIGIKRKEEGNDTRNSRGET